MVQVASLRIQIDAQQANTAAREVKRNLDEVTVAATKTEVSTDKLERQMAELLAVTSRVATNTHASAVAIQQLGQRQATAGVQVERTTERMVRQETAGSKLLKLFGGLASRTAATGGAFLAVDFLARVSGATSLMGAMNDVLDAAAGKFRDLIIGADTFAEKVNRGFAASVITLDELKDKLAEVAVKQRTATEQLVKVKGGPFGVGGGLALDLGTLDVTNPAQARDVAKVIEKLEADLAARQRRLTFSRGTASVPTEEELFGRAQAGLSALAKEYQILERNMAAWAKEDKEATKQIEAQAKAVEALDAAWKMALERGRAMRSRGRFEQFGSDFATPFALAGINAGQSYLQAQGFANQGQTGESAGAGGNAWLNAMVGASAQYAANLARIVDGQERARRSAEQFGQTAAGAFEDAVFSARSFEEGLEMVARSLVRVIFNQLVTQQLANGIASLFPSAKGNVFSGGDVVPFASGGIVSGPTVFPMRGGKTGLMGEAGPEAIMPLGRNSRGELGVKGGGGTTVVFNITTPDAQSFRKSQKQIRSDIRRLVG